MNNTRKVYLVYFSPSGATEKAVKEIASGIDGVKTETINLLTPESRRKHYTFTSNDIVIMAGMTAGKLFTLSDELFACLHGDNTPFIGVVTFGNGYYGIALNEMLKSAEAQGFKVAAMGAFVCRHSMRTSIAEGRPDSHDKEIMRDFGRKACAKICGGDYELHNKPATNRSGWETGNQVIAYREEHTDEPCKLPPEAKAKAISYACIRCRICVRNCPVDAIDIEAGTFDLDKCIGCW